MRLIRWTLCTAIAGAAIACGDSGNQPTAAPPAPPAAPPPPAPAAPAQETASASPGFFSCAYPLQVLP